MRALHTVLLMLTVYALGCASLDTDAPSSVSAASGTGTISSASAPKQGVAAAAKPEQTEDKQRDGSQVRPGASPGVRTPTDGENLDSFSQAIRQPGADGFPTPPNVIEGNAVDHLVWHWYKVFEYERIIEFTQSLDPQALGHGCSAATVYVVTAASAYLLGNEGLAKEWILQAKTSCPSYIPDQNSLPKAFCVLYGTVRP